MKWGQDQNRAGIAILLILLLVLLVLFSCNNQYTPSTKEQLTPDSLKADTTKIHYNNIA